MSGDAELGGPDLEAGVAMEELAEGSLLLGHAGGEAVLLVRRGGEVLAIGATCTHWGGPLAEGLVDGDELHCPWHHACFSLRTGEAVGAPALNPVPRWDVEVTDGRVRVTGKHESGPLATHGRRASSGDAVVIVGAGAGGAAAAEMLRRQGHTGSIALVDPDAAAPYDRPNLLKDYLAGSAPEEWIPLRPPGFWEEHGIERVVAGVTGVDTTARAATLSDGRTLPYRALVLATGARPVGLGVPGGDLPHVRVLRSLDDSRRCRGWSGIASSWTTVLCCRRSSWS
jgi:nitrite reductase/ring-hydroxylating ferredoxin subunit